MNSSQSSEAVKSIINLYTRIPDYSEVKHLGNSEFINKIDKLKEEFRQIRSSLYREEDEIDSIMKSTSKGLHITHPTHQSITLSRLDRSIVGPLTNKISNQKNHEKPSYLSVRCCEIHPNPLMTTSAYENKYSRPGIGVQAVSTGSLSHSNLFPCQDQWPHRSFDRAVTAVNEASETSSSVSLSRWSSSPEISTFRQKEYFPPQNIENRLLRRKTQIKEDGASRKIYSENLEILKPFKVHRVPSAVTKPLFHQIVEQNNRRSQKVREQSKQKLLAQVKPFSFSSKQAGSSHGLKTPQTEVPNSALALNNSKGMKSKKFSLKHTHNFRVHKNTLLDGGGFKAKPAPPRSRALMAALRLKEQQEYRELKKQLRSEALMKLSSLPPGMASRNHNRYRTPKVESPDEKYRQQYTKKSNRKREENLEDEYSNSTCTDEDRVSEDSSLDNKNNLTGNSNGSTPKKASYKTSFKGAHATGLSRILKGARDAGVFESTSNDNNASRLRIEAVRKKEEDRIRREEEECAKLRKNDEKRYKLRSFHSDVWRRAFSYSANQDIAMRRQLRMAAAILEKDSFMRDMSSMLSRVQSAPLLLQGVRERRYDLCKKHQQEMQTSARPYKYNTNIGQHSTPKKYLSRRNWTSRGDEELLLGDAFEEGHSETLAIAEGSLTISDNESTKEDQLEEDDAYDKVVQDDEGLKIEQDADDIINDKN